MSGETKEDSDVEFVTEQRQPAQRNNVFDAQQKSEAEPRASIFPHHIFLVDKSPTRPIRSFFKNDMPTRTDRPDQRVVIFYISVFFLIYLYIFL